VTASPMPAQTRRILLDVSRGRRRRRAHPPRIPPHEGAPVPSTSPRRQIPLRPPAATTTRRRTPLSAALPPPTKPRSAWNSPFLIYTAAVSRKARASYRSAPKPSGASASLRDEGSSADSPQRRRMDRADRYCVRLRASNAATAEYYSTIEVHAPPFLHHGRSRPPSASFFTAYHEPTPRTLFARRRRRV